MIAHLITPEDGKVKWALTDGLGDRECQVLKWDRKHGRGNLSSEGVSSICNG